jgi:hypothetical protein
MQQNKKERKKERKEGRKEERVGVGAGDEQDVE